MISILSTAGVLAAIALVLGAFLAVASVIFKTETDDRVEKILSYLPGANCGGCGYAGCSQLAKAVADGSAQYSLCSSISDEAGGAIAEIIGCGKKEIVKKRAVVLCKKNSENTLLKYAYDGIADCAAAERVAGGNVVCSFGCLGFGSCAKVCGEDAISVYDGLARVDENKCTGCGACAAACPRNVIELIPRKNEIFVKCKNTDKGAEVRKYCSIGCIGCKICEKNCQNAAISVDGAAKIDYDKCIGCEKCARVCPKGLISVADKKGADCVKKLLAPHGF